MVQGATRKQGSSLPRAALRLRGVARKLLGASLALAVLTLLAAAGWRLQQLPVERVIVSGELRQVTREQLMEGVNASLQGGFLWVDLQAIRAAVEQLPWVYRVVVRRVWPSSIEVHVTEQLPIARWGKDGYLNHAGELFLSNAKSELDLPNLAGPAGSQAQLMQYYKMIQDPLQANGMSVATLSMNARGGLSAQLVDGSELIFGSGDIAGKLQRFQRVYETRLQGVAGQVRSVDLRYSHGAAVAWVARTAQRDKQ